MPLRGPSGSGGGGGATALNGLSDVAIDTPANGQGLSYSDQDSYTGSFSPLSYGGTDYDDPNFGFMDPTVYFLVSPGGIGAVQNDGDPISFDTLANLHVGLCDVDGAGGSGYITIYIINGFLTQFGQSETLAGLQTVLRMIINPSLVVDNFKANAFSVTDGVFTFNGFTGFDNAGTVAVVGANTTPPTIDLVPGAAEFQNTFLPLSLYFASEKDEENGTDDVDTATPTVLNTFEFVTSRQDDYISTADDQLNALVGPAHDGIISITVTDDSGALIPSGIIELQQYDNDAMDFVTIQAVSGATCLVAPYVAQGGGGGEILGGPQEFRVQFTHSAGTTVSTLSNCKLRFAPRS